MSTRLCAWDLDGTLVDTVRDICLHVNRTLRSLGIQEQPEADIRSHIGHGATELIRGALGPHQQQHLSVAVERFRQSYDDEPVVHSELFPGALSCIERLAKEGIRSAVVTNKPRDISVKVLSKLGVLGHLVAVEGAAEGLPYKPDPTLLRRAMDAAGASVASTVMVGDSNIDVHTARAMGCAFVGVTYGMDAGAGLRREGVDPLHALPAVTDEVLRLLSSR